MIAGGHLFALLEEEHSEQLAAEITSALLVESEGEILHMLRTRNALDSQVRVTVCMGCTCQRQTYSRGCEAA